MSMHNQGMRIAFTKMQGAGNDFVVIDATRERIALTPAQCQRLADRRFGIGADQILIVEASSAPDIDFVYRIFNADGQEVEQCGNGARCFVRFVHDEGLSQKTSLRVLTRAGVIEPALQPDGSVCVDMGAPAWGSEAIGFDVAGLPQQSINEALSAHQWLLEPPEDAAFWLTAISMGNPHAVQWVADVHQHPVGRVGAWLESHPRFKNRVNAGFAQIISDTEIALRVYERGAGETLACGTGACAAVVAGILQGYLRANMAIKVQTRGGLLSIVWAGIPGAHVMMTGPAEPVFKGVIDL